MRRNASSKYVRLAAALAAALTLGACASLEERAPTVAMLAVSTPSPRELGAGREIYVTKCARCHSVESVRKYSPAQWDEIMPDMAEKTKLYPAAAAAVNAYVRAVLRSPVPGA